MKRIFALALAVGTLVLAHCGSFGGDSPSTEKPNDEAGTTGPVGGGGDGGVTGTDRDGGTQPSGPYCTELASKSKVLGCADFDHHPDLSFSEVSNEVSAVEVDAGIGREPQGLQIKGSGGGKGGGRALINVSRPDEGQTLRLHLMFRIMTLTDTESGSSASATLADVEFDPAGGDTYLAVRAISTSADPTTFYLQFDEDHRDLTARPIAVAHELEMTLTVTGKNHDQVTGKARIDQAPELTMTEVSDMKQWTIRLGAGFEGEESETGDILVDDLSVELLGP